jgi:hypothetical protein
MNMLCKTAMIAVFFVSAYPMNDELIALHDHNQQETKQPKERIDSLKTQDTLFMSFAELPYEIQEEVLTLLVPLYVADAADFKRTFGRLSLLSQVSKTFSSRLKSVCSKKGMLEGLFVSRFASPLWAFLSKCEHLEILLDISGKIVFQNDWPIRGAEKAVVDLADDVKRNELKLLASGVDTLPAMPEKLRCLLIPALLDACPAIAHLALYQFSKYDNLRDVLISIGESEEYSNRSLNNPSSKYRLLLQEMLGRFPSDDSPLGVIHAYSSKGVTLKISWGINEHNVSDFYYGLLVNNLRAGVDIISTISKTLDTIAISQEIKQMWLAARDGDVKAARELLKSNSFSAHAYEGIIGTALCLACFSGNSAIAQELAAIPDCTFMALLLPLNEAFKRGHTAFIKVLLTQNQLSMNEREMLIIPQFQSYLEPYADYDQDLLNIIASILQCPQLVALIEVCKKGNPEEINMIVKQDLIGPVELLVRGIILYRYAHPDGLKMLRETAWQNGHRNIDEYLEALHMQHFIEEASINRR